MGSVGSVGGDARRLMRSSTTGQRLRFKVLGLYRGTSLGWRGWLEGG